MRLPKFEYLTPATIDEAFSILLEYGENARVLAGGTDLLVKMKHRALIPLPEYVVNIKKIPGLNFISYDEEEGLRIGALATMQEIKSLLPIRQNFPGLAQAAGLLSTPQIRNMATIGGNLCNASPAAETAPALITSAATAKIVGQSGERTVAVEDLFTGPGETVIQQGELLAEIQVPNPPPNSTGVYLKHGKRLSDIAIVGVAVSMTMDDGVCTDAKIALASAGPTPMRVRRAEELIKGQKVSQELIEEVAKIASEESKPIDDLRAYADYRKEKVVVLVREAIKQGLQQIRLGGS